MYASRDQRRGAARVLYWFRTPPNVRVGRAALDEEAIRLLELHHAGLRFDWPRMLREKPVESAPFDETRRGERPRRARREAPTRDGRVAAGAPGSIARAAPAPPSEADEVARAEVRRAEVSMGPATEPALEPAIEEGAELSRPALPPGLHVEERVGREGFSRLRARYAELMARIAERVQEPSRLEELRTQAERLNPDTWITDEEARAGIEGFDGAYEAIRARLGRRRRRSRRGGARRRARQSQAPAGPAEVGTDPSADPGRPRDEAGSGGDRARGSEDDAE